MDGEYVRRKVKIQLGDGPDQRGEVTVETVRESDGNDGETFADWKLEVDRCTATLKDQLGLGNDEP
jgi:hypothetical protein